LAGAYVEQLEQFLTHDLTPVIHEIDGARAFEAAAQRRGKKLNVHLKIDSGMGRLGVPAAEPDS